MSAPVTRSPHPVSPRRPARDTRRRPGSPIPAPAVPTDCPHAGGSAWTAPAERPAPARRGPRERRLPAPAIVRGTECRGETRRPSRPEQTARVFARRRAVAAILVGTALAALVWFFAVVGGNYQAAAAPEPVSTSVVHVRGGESLNAVAARVAPDVPRQAVINQLRALNAMTTVTLTPGQALVVPVYR